MPPMRLGFASRLVALVTVLSVGATLTASSLLAWSNYRATLAEAEIQGQNVARLLARAASLAREIPVDVEKMLGRHMIVTAEALAQFVDAAEKAGLPPAEINRRISHIAEKTVLDEIWITDEKGFAYLHRNENADFQFDPSAEKQPQAHVFWKLLTGEADAVVQDIRKREIDDKRFKYAGVRGVDKPRIVQVGYNAQHLDALAEQIGLPRAIDNLLGGGEIDAIFVFNKDLSLIAGPNAARNSGSREGLTEQETIPVRAAIESGVTRSVTTAEKLSVISPINGEDGRPMGAALIRIPTARMNKQIGAQLQVAFAIAAATTLVGAGVAAWLARRQTAPVVAITEAARNVERRNFSAEQLSNVVARGDELGQLAHVFTTMAQDFLARERILDALVKERTAALESRNIELEKLSTRLSKYLSPQLYRSLFRDKHSTSIAAKRKKLTILFSDVVSFSEITERLESEDLTRMLNEFLNEMARIALEHGATIDKYIGDAVMIFFGDPETRGVSEDARACVVMAMEMQAATRGLERKWRDAGFERPFQIRIGVNTGYCTVGDFGSQDRMDYTIIGHQVNIAARLEQAAAPGSILISHETWSLVKDAVAAQEQEPLTVKGISAPIRTYKILGRSEPAVKEVIHEERKGLLVSVDLAAADRAEAVRVLTSALERMTAEDG